MKFYILIILEKIPNWIFLCATGYLSPYMIYLETGHLIEIFVNGWYFNQKCAGIVKMLEIV